MSRQCEIIQDLLPLYVDEICSPASREMVAEHVSSCSDCAAILAQLKNSEIENELKAETTQIIEKQNKVFKRKSALWGMIFGIALLIPLVICFIILLTSGISARSFLIIISSLLLAASLIVVPLVFLRNKFLWTLGIGTVCLILLLAVTVAFSDIRSFFVAAAASIFGLSVVFSPIVVNHKAVKDHLGSHKALVAMAADTVLFFIMMVAIGLAYGDATFWTQGMPIALIMLGFVWLIFVIIRYLKANGFIKAGICCIITGAFVFALNNILALIVGISLDWPAFRPLTWNMFTIDMNVRWLTLIACGIIGIIFIIIGLIKGGRKK